MYIIEVKNEEGVVVDRIEMPTSGPHGYSMTTVEREVEEQLHNLIDGYSFTVKLQEN